MQAQPTYTMLFYTFNVWLERLNSLPSVKVVPGSAYAELPTV